MKRLKLAKTFNSNLKGVPVQEIFRLQTPETVALLPSKIPFVKPGLLVNEGDLVSIGTPLFQDKRDTRIKFLSPGGGKIDKIIFGPRRVIEEIVIRLDRQTEEK
ncbi:MAG: NADH-quinone reductase, partial [Desulfamplus sp.]|nr:NADH-quinone reductase [Desulfamplus sp.]